MSLMCPDCAVALIPETFMNVTFVMCQKCDGLWFEAEKLKQIQQMSDDELPKLDEQFVTGVERVQDTPAGRPCPACQTPMSHYRYLMTSAVYLDGCEQCNGIWVDHGELTRMHDALQGQLTDAPQGPQGTSVGPSLPPEAEAVLAKFQVQHDAEMARYHRLTSACRWMSFRAPWWMWFGF